MPQPTRKRPAPGSEPVSSPMQAQYEQPSSMQFSYPTLQQGFSNETNGFQTDNFQNPEYSNPAVNINSPIPPRQNGMELARRSGRQQNMVQSSQSGRNGDTGGWQNGTNDNLTSGCQAFDDEEAALDQKAMAVQKEATSSRGSGRKSIPPFVQKLRSYLDNPSNIDLIRWSSDGTSFIILDEEEFSKNLLPELFKHANYASFVRQLNMYGFHKMVGLSDNSMRASERKAKSPNEYSHPYFKRDHGVQMWLITKSEKPGGKRGGRKGQQNGDDDVDDVDADEVEIQDEINATGHHRPQQLLLGSSESIPQEQFAQIQAEVLKIQHQQAMLNRLVAQIKAEHQTQAVNFKAQLDRHENSVNAILTFLATVYQRSLDGQGQANIANLFAHAIPGQSGGVVDVGEFAPEEYSQPSASPRPLQRRQLLLQAPPPSGNDGSPRITSVASTPGPALDSPQAGPQQRPSGSSSQSRRYPHTSPLVNGSSTASFPQTSPSTYTSEENNPDIISIINSTNASANTADQRSMDFPQALSHIQAADGKLPLSPNQRQQMLHLMGDASSGDPGSNGTSNGQLVNPLSGANNPQLQQLAQTYQGQSDMINQLESTLKDHDNRVENLANLVRPLTPDGSIPPYQSSEAVQPFDFGQFLNSSDDFDYFSNTLGNDHGNENGIANNKIDFDKEFPGAGNEFDSSNLFGDNQQPGTAFASGQANDGSGRVVETVNSSEATSPANTIEDPPKENRSARKRQRRS